MERWRRGPKTARVRGSSDCFSIGPGDPDVRVRLWLTVAAIDLAAELHLPVEVVLDVLEQGIDRELIEYVLRREEDKSAA